MVYSWGFDREKGLLWVCSFASIWSTVGFIVFLVERRLLKRKKKKVNRGPENRRLNQGVWDTESYSLFLSLKSHRILSRCAASRVTKRRQWVAWMGNKGTAARNGISSASTTCCRLPNCLLRCRGARPGTAAPVYPCSAPWPWGDGPKALQQHLGQVSEPPSLPLRLKKEREREMAPVGSCHNDPKRKESSRIWSDIGWFFLQHQQQFIFS